MIRTTPPAAPSAILLSAVLLLGCSSSDDADDGVAPVTPPPGEAPGTLLEGVWESPCLSESEGMALSRDLVLSITERVFELNNTSYGDATCGEGDELQVFATRGILEELPIEDQRVPEDGIPIDVMVSQLTLEPRQVPVANQFNAQALCGRTDWVPEVNQDVSNCDEIEDSEAPRTDFNRYFVDDMSSIDDRSDDTLALGTLSAQTDPSARPEGLDGSIVFTRRPGSL